MGGLLAYDLAERRSARVAGPPMLWLLVGALGWLCSIAGSDQHAALIAGCLRHLDVFRLSAQVAGLDAVLRELAVPACTGVTRP